jgi:hypothetical protein
MAQTTQQELATFESLTVEIPALISNSASEVTAYQRAYRESVETDVLVQLRFNIQELEDLHGRLRFAMSELKALLKRG